jgi:hypothetical protein
MSIRKFLVRKEIEWERWFVLIPSNFAATGLNRDGRGMIQD